MAASAPPIDPLRQTGLPPPITSVDLGYLGAEAPAGRAPEQERVARPSSASVRAAGSVDTAAPGSVQASEPKPTPLHTAAAPEPTASASAPEPAVPVRSATENLLAEPVHITLWARMRSLFSGDSDKIADEKAKKALQKRLTADPTPFRFKPVELCNLVDPENVQALQEMGGVQGVLAGLGSNAEQGLTTGGAPPSSGGAEKVYSGSLDERARVYGRNVLPARKTKSLLMLMWLALQDKILVLLIVASIVSLALGLYTDFSPPTETGPCLHPPPGELECALPKVNWVEGVAILVAVFIVDLVGSLNDWQKERQFRMLDAKKEKRDVTVIRNGTRQMIDVHHVLVGDVVAFEPGEVVAFDGIVLRGHNIKCDESSVTGESDMINKLPYEDYIQELGDGSVPLKRKSCFLISGSKVLEGVGEFVVIAVGPMSCNGRLMMSLREEPENTPLQMKLNRLAELIAKLGTSAGLLLFVALMIRFFVQLGRDKSDGTPRLDSNIYGEKFIDILIISVTIIVVAVPEGLPLAVTLALAFATRRMSEQNLLVRVLGSCETMANATCVCTDKTGTLTQNKMNVVAGCIGSDLRFQNKIKFEVDRTTSSDDLIDMDDLSAKLPASVRTLLTDSICINSTAFIPELSDADGHAETKQQKPWYARLFPSKQAKTEEVDESGTQFVGSKTETALLGMVLNEGWGDYAQIRKAADIVQMIPFGSKRKAMGVVIKTTDGYRLLVKGASEVLLGLCSAVVSVRGAALDAAVENKPLTDALRAELNEVISSYALQSLRTISLCYRDFSSWPPANAPQNDAGEVEYEFLAQDMMLLGITAIEDPLRNGVPDAVEACHHAGVNVKMCTGDNILTARSIATQCGIYQPGGIVIEGPNFRQLSDEDLTHIAPSIQVLARSSPEDKKKLIEKLKRMGEVVAVTGDGTNDGPALKAAHVGFSMGIAGSEVAKEASDIILLDDNFSSIVKAIMWGRCVNDAVRKFLQFQTTVNVVAVVVTFVTAVASNNQDSALTAVQLLWLNLIMDTLAALALATDPADKVALERKPDRSSTPLITVDMWKHITVQSIYQIVLIFVLNFKGLKILGLHSENPGVNAQSELVLGSLIFNVFVFCQLFNQVNARSLNSNLNIFHKVDRNIWFLGIMAIEIGMQVLIMFVGGATFSVTRLAGKYWGITIVAGLLSWPLGALTRLIPTPPIERLLIKLHVYPDPNALPVVSHEAEDAKKITQPSYDDWNEPAVGRLAQQLGAYSRVRGGRLRASNLVMRSNKRLMNEHNIRPKNLLAIVPAFIGASVGGGWRPATSGNETSGEVLPEVSAQTLFQQGKLQFHPDTPADFPALLYVQGK